ncbi:autotransporter outer membrane beta-barrel domain-containing protein [Neolewinella persica]|uniref:hypothetical protein n=1 Tax=Neolewinella persica TaxID=70998 RepID=UPI000370B41A|nr:hypothetical protein [Neolewinella persica]
MRKHLLLTFAVLLFSCSLFAQATITWDGGGATTDWNDMLNWDGDVVPTAVDKAVFNTNVTVTGTAPAALVQLQLASGAQVIFDLDLTVGDGTTAGNTIELFSGARLVIENGRSFNLLPEANSNGFQIGSGATGATVNVKGTASMTITGGKHGVNIANATASFVQRGTTMIINSTGNGIRLTDGEFINSGGLMITGAALNGIDNAANFTNFRSSTTVLTITNAVGSGIKNKATGIFINDKEIIITGGGVTSDGINTEGAFTNMENSDITTSGMDDDGIEVVAGTFDNDGAITTMAKTGATSANNALAITGGILTNTSNNSLNADGGDTGRAIGIAAAGSLLNTGTVTLTGGDDGNRINSGGDVTNDIGGTIDLTDGRINTSGTLTNNGLIISTRGAAGIFNTGTATNNAYFTYGGGNFASGSGTFDDQGIDLDKGSSWRIDVMNGCSVKLANVPYEYEEGSTSVGTSAADGTLTFDDMTFSAADINIKPVGLSFPTGLKVRLQNATCNPALPIELSALEAVAMPKSIMVKWTTATEIDNDYIAVERSIAGAVFTEIGRVAGYGTRRFAADYELEDAYPVSGTNYYRLRQVDQDGTTTYSHVVSADFAGANAGAMKVFPTVVSAGGQLNVDLREMSFAVLVLADAHGRQVSTYQLEGGVVASLPIPNLQPGMYYLRNSGNAVTTRFIIQ